MKRNFPRVALVVFLAALTGCDRVVVGISHAPPAPPAPPDIPVVPVVVATPVPASISLEAVATLGGATSLEIHSPVSGYLVKQAYQDGALVRAGDVLFEIDTTHTASGQATSTKITSPIAGVPAHAIPGIGDLINPSMTLTTVSSIDTITADFALPVPVYRDHAAWFAQLLAQPIATRAENVRLVLEDGTIYPATGRLSAIENPQPSSTPTVSASALFPNPDHLLRPGQFAKVRITIDTANAPPQ